MPSKPVTKQDCEQIRKERDKIISEQTDDIRLIKAALVGTDLRGGLVNQVNNLATRIEDILRSQKIAESIHESERGEDRKSLAAAKLVRAETVTRYKILALTVGGAVAGIVIGHFLDAL